MSGRIVVVGDVVLDVVVRPLSAVAPTSDTPAQVRVGRGGSGANLAVALRAVLARGYDVVFAGVAGHDAAAQIVRADLGDAGVRAHLTLVEGATGVVVSLVGEGGERAMLTQRGANHHLAFEHVAGMFDASLRHVHVSGYTALDDDTRTLVPRFFAAARHWGATTSIDVCSVNPLGRVGPDVFRDAARGATMLFANEEEATLLAGDEDVDRALDVLSRDWREVVITRGSRGAIARVADEVVTADARVDEVFDTTGAGDSATGTYLAHRLVGVNPATALGLAMDAAAHVVRGLGSRG